MSDRTFKPSPRALVRSKRADQIVEEVKRWIVASELRPGDRLPKESELEELLQSSRGTVREGLKVLESDGLIEIMRGPKGGARISSVSYEKASASLRNFLYFQPLTWSDIYRVREKLEPMMAMSVVDTLTDDDIAALRDTIEICKLGIKGKVTARAHRIAELEYHSILACACPNPLLALLSRFISDMLTDLSISDPDSIIPARDSRFATKALKYHSMLLDAYEKRDAERVGAIMDEHVHDAGCIVSTREEEVAQDSLLVAHQTKPLHPQKRSKINGTTSASPKKSTRPRKTTTRRMR